MSWELSAPSLAADQGQLFLAAQLLDGPLPGHGGLFCGKAFPVDQGHRTPGAGVFGAPSGVVGGETLCQVIGPAGVQAAVGAAKDIGKTFHAVPLRSLKLSCKISLTVKIPADTVG